MSVKYLPKPFLTRSSVHLPPIPFVSQPRGQLYGPSSIRKLGFSTRNMVRVHGLPSLQPRISAPPRQAGRIRRAGIDPLAPQRRSRELVPKLAAHLIAPLRRSIAERRRQAIRRPPAGPARRPAAPWPSRSGSKMACGYELQAEASHGRACEIAVVSGPPRGFALVHDDPHEAGQHLAKPQNSLATRAFSSKSSRSRLEFQLSISTWPQQQPRSRQCLATIHCALSARA